MVDQEVSDLAARHAEAVDHPLPDVNLPVLKHGASRDALRHHELHPSLEAGVPPELPAEPFDAAGYVRKGLTHTMRVGIDRFVRISPCSPIERIFTAPTTSRGAENPQSLHW